MNKIVIRGHEFELGVYDLDELKRRDDADKVLGQKIAAVDLIGDPTYGSLVMVLDELERFFDDALGAGSLAVILDGKRDVADALEAYYELRDAILDATLTRAMEIARRAKVPEKYNMDKVKR